MTGATGAQIAGAWLEEPWRSGRVGLVAMPVDDLQKVNQRIAETRLRIGDQRAIVDRLREDGRDVSEPEALLKALERSLAALEELKKTSLREFRQPRATSQPRPEEKSPTKRRRRSAA